MIEHCLLNDVDCIIAVDGIGDTVVSGVACCGGTRDEMNVVRRLKIVFQDVSQVLVMEGKASSHSVWVLL